MGEIEGIPGIREVALFGKGLHVVVQDGDAAGRAIRLRLEEQGFTDTVVEEISPSLEDVFVSLIEARDVWKSRNRR